MTLQKLISTREGIRKVVKNRIDRISEDSSNSLDVLSDTIEYLQQKSNSIKTLNDKILNQIDATNVEEEIIQSEELSFDLYTKIKALKRQLHEHTVLSTNGNKSQNASPQQQLSSSAAENRSNSQHSSVSTASHHRLPKLTLPTFTGDITQWQTFWDSFESSVHTNQTLSDVDKFSYLRSLLEESAASCINGFPLTSSNYSKAIELLKERFGQSDKIIAGYMKSLLDLPRPSFNFSRLRDFSDLVETYVRGLESLGQCQESYGSLLVPIILEKLPGEIRSNLARAHDSSSWVLADLRVALRKELSIMEAGQPVHTKAAMELTVSFFAGAENTRKRKRVSSDSVQIQETEEIHIFKKCRLCNGTHSEINCTRFTSRETRLTEIQKGRLCYNCLGNHQVSDCRSKFRCRQCQRKHHTCICDNKLTATQLNPNADSSIPRSTSDTEAAVLHDINQQKETVFLKTAEAPVASRHVCRESNILFDEGATRSFITQELADALQLPQDKSEEVQLASFGGHVEEIRQSKLSTVYICTDDKRRVPVDVLIVPTITTPITNNVRYVNSLKYLQGLKLAHKHSTTDRFDVELLIGADSYWSIVEDQTVRGDGPTAVKSRIGYLLSGPLTLPSAEPAREHMMTLITSSPAKKPIQKMSIHVQHNAKNSSSRESSTNKDDQRRIKRRSRRRGKGRVRRRVSRRAATVITDERSDKAAITEGRVGGRAPATPCDADLVTVNDEIQPPPSSWRRPWRRRLRSLRDETNTTGHDNATHPGSHEPHPRRERTRGTIYPRLANTRCRSTKTMAGGDGHLAGRRMSWTAGRRADRGDVTHTKPRATST